MRIHIRTTLYALLLILLFPFAGHSQLTLNPTLRGWYQTFQGNITGFPDFNPNYVAGNSFFAANTPQNETFHNFFQFDLTGVGSDFDTATLRLFNPENGYRSSDLFETYSLFDYTSSIPALSLLSGIPVTQTEFDDLGNGISYGSVDVSSSDDNSWIEITLNSSGLNDILNALGGSFVIGGAITTISPGDTQTIFNDTQFSGVPAPQLVLSKGGLTAVPEPSAYGTLAAFALIALVGQRLRRQRG